MCAERERGGGRSPWKISLPKTLLAKNGTSLGGREKRGQTKKMWGERESGGDSWVQQAHREQETGCDSGENKDHFVRLLIGLTGEIGKRKGGKIKVGPPNPDRVPKFERERRTGGILASSIEVLSKTLSYKSDQPRKGVSSERTREGNKKKTKKQRRKGGGEE